MGPECAEAAGGLPRGRHGSLRRLLIPLPAGIPVIHPKSRAKTASKRERRDASRFRHFRRRLSDRMALLYPLVGWFALGWRWLIQRTVRIDRRGAAFSFMQRREPFIFTYWHHDQLPVLFEVSRAFSYMPPLYMLSPGRTGALSASVLDVVGVKTVAGSGSNKGWEAIDILTRRVRRWPQSVFLLADGSRGPDQELRWGAVNLARDTGLPVIVARSWGNNLFCLRWTWMKLAIPLPRPWGRCVVLTSDPLWVKPDATLEDLAEARRELQSRLDAMGEAAHACIDGNPSAADNFGPPIANFPFPSSELDSAPA